MKRVWRWWLKLGVAVGTAQMIILLSVIYWTLLAITAIPYRLLADPLGLRSPVAWRRRANPQTRPDMRRQY